MTHVVIPNRPLPAQNRDINAILANFDAITNVINGQLGGDNLENESITLAKVEKGLFLELLTGGEHRKVAWGKGVVSFSPGLFQQNVTVVHGLGKTPEFLIATCSTIAVQEAGEPRRCVVVSPNKDLGEVDVTNLYLTFEVVANYTITNNNTPFWWLAIA